MDKTSEYKWTGNSFSYHNLMSVHTDNIASVAGSRLAVLRDCFGHTDSYSIFVDVGVKFMLVRLSDVYNCFCSETKCDST